MVVSSSSSSMRDSEMTWGLYAHQGWIPRFLESSRLQACPWALLESLQSSDSAVLARLAGRLAGWLTRMLRGLRDNPWTLLESLQSSDPAVLANLAGRLAGQNAKGVKRQSVGPTRRLDSSIPGVLEAAGLAGWDRLAQGSCRSGGFQAGWLARSPRGWMEGWWMVDTGLLVVEEWVVDGGWWM